MSLFTLSKTNALRASLRVTFSHTRFNKNCRCSCVKWFIALALKEGFVEIFLDDLFHKYTHSIVVVFVSVLPMLRTQDPPVCRLWPPVLWMCHAAFCNLGRFTHRHLVSVSCCSVVRVKMFWTSLIPRTQIVTSTGLRAVDSAITSVSVSDFVRNSWLCDGDPAYSTSHWEDTDEPCTRKNIDEHVCEENARSNSSSARHTRLCFF